jgi:hypothetical protein
VRCNPQSRTTPASLQAARAIGTAIPRTTAIAQARIAHFAMLFTWLYISFAAVITFELLS